MSIPRFVHIEGPGNERLVRDTQSMALINTNGMAYNAAIKRSADAKVKLAAQHKQTITVLTLQKDVASIQSEITAIKEMLTTILNKLS